jgi:hypothetical protein
MFLLKVKAKFINHKVGNLAEKSINQIAVVLLPPTNQNCNGF